MPVIVKSFRAVERNTLRGFADITLINVRLTIRDVAIHYFDPDRWWVGLPARPMVEKDGTTPVLNPRTGKQDYFAFLRFDD